MRDLIILKICMLKRLAVYYDALQFMPAFMEYMPSEIEF